MRRIERGKREEAVREGNEERKREETGGNSTRGSKKKKEGKNGPKVGAA
jgi:hypothetical protein